MLQELVTKLDSLVSTTVASNVGGVIGYVTPIMGVAVCLYLTYKALEYFYAPPDIPIMDMVKFYIALVLIMAIALNADMYISNIVPIVTGTGDELAKLFSESNADLGSTLDQFVENYLLAMWDIWTMSSGVVGTLFAIFSITILLIGGLPIIITIIAYILLAKLLLTVVAILGVIYICFLFFPTTRGMFFSWLSQFATYTLLLAILGLTLGMMFNFINEFVMQPLSEKGGDSGYFFSIVWAAIVLRAFDAVLESIVTLAASLGGGAGVSGGRGLASSAASLLGGGTARKLGGMAANSAKSLGKQAGQKIWSGLTGRGRIEGG